jgi:type II secretory pathway pseudopilin PulG
MTHHVRTKQPGIPRGSAGRLGFTLIELLAYLPLIAGITTVTFQLVYRTSQANRKTVGDMEIRASVDQLAEDLRNDVRDATEVAVGSATPKQLVITWTNGQRVIYVQDGNRIVRTVTATNSTKSLQLETYEFRREQIGVSWSVDGRVVTLKVQRRSAGPSAVACPTVTVNAAMRSHTPNRIQPIESDEIESRDLEVNE